MSLEQNKEINFRQLAGLLEQHGIIWCFDGNRNIWIVYDSINEDGFYESGLDKYQLMTEAMYSILIGKFNEQNK